MGRYFALTLGIPAQIKTKPAKAMPQSRTNWGIWIVILFFVMGVVYLTQVNSTATKGYEIKKLDTELNALKESNKRLDLETASLKSIQHIEASVKNLNLVPSGKVQYVGQNGYAFQN
jgi:hypothetical protein